MNNVLNKDSDKPASLNNPSNASTIPVIKDVIKDVIKVKEIIKKVPIIQNILFFFLLFLILLKKSFFCQVFELFLKEIYLFFRNE